MFGTKSSKKAAEARTSGQALVQRSGITKRKKSVASTIAVYGTSTIVGKAKAN